MTMETHFIKMLARATFLYNAFFAALRAVAVAVAAAVVVAVDELEDFERPTTSPSSIRGALTMAMLAQHATLKYNVIQHMEYRQSSYDHVRSCSSMLNSDASPSDAVGYDLPLATLSR